MQVSDEVWRSEASHYTMRELARDVVVYVRKSDAAVARPAEMFCPSCFWRRRVSVYERVAGTPKTGEVYACPTCQSVFALNGPLFREF